VAGESAPVQLIQQQLGHANLHTTTIYLRSNAPVELVATTRRHTWVPGLGVTLRVKPDVFLLLVEARATVERRYRYLV